MQDNDTQDSAFVISIGLLEAALTSRHAADLMAGSETHMAALHLVGELVAHTSDASHIREIVVGCLPPDYAGNTLDEIPGMVRDSLRSAPNPVQPPSPATKAPSKAVAHLPADHDLIQQECEWYGHSTGDGAATADEPNWHAAASITARCKDGERIFHKYSARHPGYDEREAMKKFQRAVKEAGPRTCEAVSSELGNERFCDRCQHRGLITSPIQLASGYDPGRNGPRPLGFTKEGHFALLDPVRKIIILASAQQLLAQQFLLGLAESGFWRQRFPGRKPGSANYAAAGEALMKACRRAGPFNPSRVRGRGIWLEGDKVVVNLGEPIESKRFVYLCFEPVPFADPGVFDAQRLYDHLKLYNWRYPQDAGLLFGWLAMAPVCGALVWRPHAFVYGPARSGKTTIHAVASTVLTPLAISADGQSTEAGIRQTLGPDSLPILIDEFESDQRGTTLSNVLRLARSASSADTPVLRGTPEGKALSFAARARIKRSVSWPGSRIK